MLKRQLFALIFTLLCFSGLFAQKAKVKWKDGLLLLEGKPTMHYEIIKGGGAKVYVYTNLKGDQELWQAHFCPNQSRSSSDDYRHYYFPSLGMEMILPRKNKYGFQYLFPKMMEAGVVDGRGNFNPDAAKVFIEEHHIPLPGTWDSPVHRLPVVGHPDGKVHRWKE